MISAFGVEHGETVSKGKDAIVRGIVRAGRTNETGLRDTLLFNMGYKNMGGRARAKAIARGQAGRVRPTSELNRVNWNTNQWQGHATRGILASGKA